MSHDHAPHGVGEDFDFLRLVTLALIAMFCKSKLITSSGKHLERTDKFADFIC